MAASWIDKTLLIGLTGLNLLGVAVIIRMLLSDPAPAFSRLSLTRQAIKVLPARENSGFLSGLRAKWDGTFGWVRFLLLAVTALAAAWIPVDVALGPLNDHDESDGYISTMWQVVAAAVGLSVAMVAFAFEAFQTSGQRAYGGSLKEFARESRLVLLIEAGLIALLVDGAVLGGWGDRAPAGWAGLWAIGSSAIALLLVGYVVHRVLNLLDDRALRQMRTRRVDRLVADAMKEQLLGQAADIWLDRSTIGIERTVLAPPGSAPVYGNRAGEVRDIWVGPLARFVVRASHRRVALAVGLGQAVDAETALLYVDGDAADVPRRVLRGIRVRDRPDAAPQAALSAALSTLHQQAIAAAKTGNELEWRAISESYEQILLALPRAAADWGVPFEGAVVAPGFFGQGPVQQIAQFLYDELAAAVDSNSRELIGPITYFPQHVAVAAARLGAPAVAGPMLGIFPAMYLLAKSGP